MFDLQPRKKIRKLSAAGGTTPSSKPASQQGLPMEGTPGPGLTPLPNGKSYGTNTTRLSPSVPPLTNSSLKPSSAEPEGNGSSRHVISPSRDVVTEFEQETHRQRAVARKENSPSEDRYNSLRQSSSMTREQPNRLNRSAEGVNKGVSPPNDGKYTPPLRDSRDSGGSRGDGKYTSPLRDSRGDPRSDGRHNPPKDARRSSRGHEDPQSPTRRGLSLGSSEERRRTDEPRGLKRSRDEPPPPRRDDPRRDYQPSHGAPTSRRDQHQPPPHQYQPHSHQNPHQHPHQHQNHQADGHKSPINSPDGEPKKLTRAEKRNLRKERLKGVKEAALAAGLPYPPPMNQPPQPSPKGKNKKQKQVNQNPQQQQQKKASPKQKQGAVAGGVVANAPKTTSPKQQKQPAGGGAAGIVANKVQQQQAQAVRRQPASMSQQKKQSQPSGLDSSQLYFTNPEYDSLNFNPPPWGTHVPGVGMGDGTRTMQAWPQWHTGAHQVDTTRNGIVGAGGLAAGAGPVSPETQGTKRPRTEETNNDESHGDDPNKRQKT